MRILAGLAPHQTDTEEVLTWLRAAVRELGFDVLTPEQSVEVYVCDVARRVLTEELTPYDGAWEFELAAQFDGKRYRELVGFLDQYGEYGFNDPDRLVLEASHELLSQVST